jgi:hypothetical protein
MLVIGIVLYGGVGMAKNYQPQKDPLNKEVRNPLKENIGEDKNARYNQSQRCDFIEETKDFNCTTILQPRIGTARKPGATEEKAPTIQNKGFEKQNR